jgi:hypothetical protein
LDNRGENLVIGIADSIRCPELTDQVTLGESVDYYNGVGRDPVGHGSKVFKIIHTYLPDAQYNFYRVVGGIEEEKRCSGYLVDAISDAKRHGCDFLNVSGGTQIDLSPEASSLFEANNALRRGLKIVSAAGNYLEDRVHDITYPASLSDSIAVKGYEPICSCTQENPEPTSCRYTYSASSLSEIPESTKVYCSYSDYDSGTCAYSNQCSLRERCWSGNIDSDSETESIFAPVIFPKMSNGQLRPARATSYSAPIVTAVVGRVLSNLKSTREPSAKEFNQEIQRTGAQLAGDEGKKPNAKALLEELGKPNGVHPLVDNGAESQFLTD